MTHTELETIPATWSEERDGAFFALVHDLFPAAFVSGATALLMSYDDDGSEPAPATLTADAGA